MVMIMITIININIITADIIHEIIEYAAVIVIVIIINVKHITIDVTQ